jgi:hypothetical protein
MLSLITQNSLFSTRLRECRQNTDFSALWKDIAAWETASTALDTKVTDLQNDMDNAQATVLYCCENTGSSCTPASRRLRRYVVVSKVQWCMRNAAFEMHF